MIRFFYTFLCIFSVTFLLSCSKGKGDPAPGGGGEVQPPIAKEIQKNHAIFLDPVLINAKKSDTKILDSLVRWVKHTPKGETIHISIFLMSYEPLIHEIRSAANRGVAVQLLIDNGREESERENQSTITSLLAAFKAPSKLITFKSDASSTAINHNKYVLFSRLQLPEGIVKNLVFSSSHNFVEGGTKKIQDAVVMSQKALYDAFLANWNETSRRAKIGMKDFVYREVDMDSLMVSFFPRRKNGGWDGKDNYLELFDRITDVNTANIRVVMSDWSRVEVAEKLTELQKKGARVEVIAKDKSTPEVLAELERLSLAGGYVNVVKMSEKNTHSKITLVDAMLDGKRQKLVLTGSHNYTYNALKNNNEVLLTLRSGPWFKWYNDYFDTLKKVL